MNPLKKLFIKDGDFYKRVLLIAVPIAMQSAITIGVNMLDTIMLGKVGENELSASSLANQFISIFHIFCMGIGMGASVLVSRYYAMKEKESVKKTVCLMLRIMLLLATLFAVGTALFPKQIMSSYTDDTILIGFGSEYLTYSIATFFFLGLSLTCTIVLRSVGRVYLPLCVSIGAFFVNLFANYVLIFGKFGFPKLGVAGAALGTLISRVFETLIICGMMFFFDKRIQFRIKDLFMRVGGLVKEYIRISIPVLISDGILALGNNSVAMVIGHLGASFTAANAITSVTQQMSSVVIQGVCQAGAIVTGYALGEGNKEKAQRQGFAFLGLGLSLGLVAALFITLASGPIVGAYDVSKETADMAIQLMLAISIIIVFQATNSIMTKGVLRGGGDTQMLMFADNIFLWVVSLPLGLLAGFVWHLPPFFIYICLKADQITKAVWCVFRLRSGKWIKKIKVN